MLLQLWCVICLSVCVEDYKTMWPIWGPVLTLPYSVLFGFCPGNAFSNLYDMAPKVQSPDDSSLVDNTVKVSYANMSFSSPAFG